MHLTSIIFGDQIIINKIINSNVSIANTRTTNDQNAPIADNTANLRLQTNSAPIKFVNVENSNFSDGMSTGSSLNVLFEGGAGETIRKKLMETCDLHTILRLPTGVFYAQGVKANVLFFDKKPAQKEAATSQVWIYDLRTNKHFTLKESPLNIEDLQDFIKCYNPENRHQRKESERFKSFSYDEILKRDKTNLDIFWLKDESLDDLDKLPSPEIIAKELVEDLENALEQLKEINDDLSKNG